MRSVSSRGKSFTPSRVTGPDALSVIRERGFITRILILSHLRANPHATLREIGERLGVTMQAVSVYLQDMTRAGLMDERSSGGRRLTHSGVQWLQDALLATKNAVDAALEPLTVIKVTSALAADTIAAGAPVGLSMEDGILVARVGKTSSSGGRATNSASRGDEVLVSDLSGIVDLQPGRIHVVRLPGPEEGGASRVDIAGLRQLISPRGSRWSKVGIVGLGARVVSETLELRRDFEFGAAHSAFHAASLGLSSMLLVTGDYLKATIANIEQLNAQTRLAIAVDILQAPTITSSPTENAMTKSRSRKTSTATHR